ncbi:carboxypeptidase-like regulatory domain-containing protein [uncultured Porphyromonas sp.]|uniref:carboxypeptidase-like regulatory domain-containing protein n=1 Tax=uncultured Porphyromonas sp. TaxID=159274 RepID=UPI0025875A92|nr:carboxypeptidase-like regulatory domain-containing protein [uncultured Porphyromonas sp.]
MKQFYRLIMLSLLLGFTCASSWAQKTYTGVVVDGDTHEPLIGAVVVDSKDSSKGTTTNMDGKFTISLTGNGTLEVSYLGYLSTTVKYSASGKSSLGTISIFQDNTQLGEVLVVGKGVIDVANRVTPIASTIVKASEIQMKAVGNVEFPEALKNTPNVYVANQAGGFGDSKMFMRGFDQSNTAFLLNGQPINGMEDGKMYWSNWAGISDIANAIDVQRGLGSSKLAISSVGGTINIVTKATDLERGGFVRFIGGYGKYFKGTAAYNTGLLSNGWGVSVLIDHWQGERKWNDGTQGSGQNYFLSIGKKAGDHMFNFLIFGAPQWHNQHFSLKQELYDQYGYKYNKNWGYYNGKVLSERKNYYHKPVMNLNWDWNISKKQSLSTVLYASFGRGGGTGAYGNGPDYLKDANGKKVGRDADGQIRWDFIENECNKSIAGGYGKGYNGTAIRSSVNNHHWFGLVSNYSYDNHENLSVNVGADLRFYKGDHFRQLTELFGLKGWNDAKGRNKSLLDANGAYLITNTYKADPWASLFNYAPTEDRIGYNSSEWINYQGLFGQVEYHNDLFSSFLQAAFSNQSYRASENFLLLNEKSDVINRFGFNIKGGASILAGENHKFFANAGYYSRQPFKDNIFEYSTIRPREQKVENENILGLEAGYSAKLPGYTTINLNVYYTSWANRFLAFGMDDYTTPNTHKLLQSAGFRLSNVTQIHKGVELDIRTHPLTGLMLRGHFTYGDWKYSGKTPVEVIDNDSGNSVADKFEIELAGTKVGSAPQSTLGFGAEYKAKGFVIFADYNHYLNLYGDVDIKKLAEATVKGKEYKSQKLDNYGLLDMGASYRFALTGKQGILIRANVYNVLNKRYVASLDNYGLYYGPGTTFNASVTYEF